MEIGSLLKQEANAPSPVNTKTEVKEADTVSQNTKKNESEKKEKGSYTAISKDGDTLQISENVIKSGDSTKIAFSDKTLEEGGGKMSDAELAKCSKTKLKQLLQKGTITKQQYEKAMKRLER